MIQVNSNHFVKFQRKVPKTDLERVQPSALLLNHSEYFDHPLHERKFLSNFADSVNLKSIVDIVQTLLLFWRGLGCNIHRPFQNKLSENSFQLLVGLNED
jgi:hypothetical protein